MQIQLDELGWAICESLWKSLKRRRPAPPPNKRIAIAFNRKLPRAGKGHVSAFDRDRALSSLEHNAVFGEDVDLVAGAGHRYGLVGEHFQFIGVRLQADLAGGGDGLDATGVTEPARAFSK